MEYIKRIVNTDNSVIDLPFTKEEIELYEKEALLIKNAELKQEAEILEKAAQRQAILDRLGLTADEVKLLLG